jgi:hypothetical protein
MELLLALVLAQQLLVAEFDPSSATFPSGLTCREAWEAETRTGGKTPLRGPFNPQSSAFVFFRTYLGFDATIMYICKSERLAWRVITIDVRSRELAQDLVARHTARMNEQFGAPCWDPGSLTDEQMARHPPGAPTADLMSRRTIWSIDQGRISGVSLPTAPWKLGTWRVVIDAGLPLLKAQPSDPLEKAFDVTGCTAGDAPQN